MVSRLPSLCVLLLTSLSFALTAVSGRQPNVVVILTDDQGWGDLSSNGNTNLATPRIDSLGKDGAVMERFYVCPVCAPTRAEFMTGRFFGRTGVHGVSTGQERLNLDETTVAQVFKAGGYATAAFGKWHNGTQSPYHPNDRGFEEFYGFCSGHWGQYFDTDMDHNGHLVKGKGFIIDDLTEHALEFMEAHQDKPFFCYLPYNTPHSPMQVPEAFYKKFANAELKLHAREPNQEDVLHTRAALAMCENIDWNVGRVLDKLKALNLENDTIVIYFSDNGPSGWRWNGEMKGKKGTVDEGGVRVPFLIRWPGKIAAGLRVPQIGGAIDLLPTLTEMAGVRLTPTKPLDGRSLKPLLVDRAGAQEWQERVFISMQGGAKRQQLSVRSQQFRLDPAGGLYDLVADPRQDHNVAAAHPEEVKRLKGIAAKYAGEVAPVLAAAKDRPYTVGYSVLTPLPARDGEPNGTVERSAKAPNCSYFTHWTSTDDSMTWDVQVGTPGRYVATVYYTCAPENVGAVIELTFAGKSVRTTVAEAHNPPAVGAADDRAPRGTESYVKDFKPLRMGEMELSATRGLLTLRALKIPGKEAAEVRYVMLERVGE